MAILTTLSAQFPTKKEFEQSLQYSREALQIAEEAGSPRDLCNILSVISDNYLYMKNYKECERVGIRSWATDSVTHGIAGPTALGDFAAPFSNVRFHFFGEEKRIEERIEFVMYCCANELVNNAVKYSGAKNIDVQLVQGDDYIALTVEDDGCGFDGKTVTKGIGLKNIRNRVASCGGKIDIVTSPGKGTEATVEIKVNL